MFVFVLRLNVPVNNFSVMSGRTICIHLFIVLNRCVFYFVLSCLGSHKQARGVHDARAGKENIFLT